MSILAGISILIGLIVVYLTIIAFFPFKVEKQPIELKDSNGDVPTCRQDVTFKVNNLELSGCFICKNQK